MILSNSNRIAKNTLALYVRMLFMMLVGLYTSRVVLDALGEANYGIYNVVGGVVPMLSVLTGVLSGAISRFITFELGVGNQERLKRIFSTSVNIQFIMALAAFVSCEVIGVWFLNEKMNIPSDRIEAAYFVLQCSIASFMVTLVSVPYNAVIVAHERMSAFAYISIIEAILKLIIAYLIYISPVDTLKLYAFLLFVVSLIMRVIYGVYCRKHFVEAQYHFLIDRSLLKQMFGFAGWNLLGNTTYMFSTQGVNMLVNIFFGVTTNAAQAIASQVNGAVSQLVHNFCTALNPQIIKSYASGDYNYFYKLIIRGSKFTYFIMFVVVVPLMLEIDTVLGIWLKSVPNSTAIFVRLSLISAMVTLLGNSMLTAILATGKIRRYEIIVAILGILILPLTWIVFKLGFPAYTSYIIYILIYFIFDFVRLFILKNLVNFPIYYFIKTVIYRIIVCSITSFVFPAILIYLMTPSFLRLILVCFTSFLWSIPNILYIGMEKEERLFLFSKARLLIKKFISKRTNLL